MNCLLNQKQCSMPARKRTEQYNAKRESMKDYKYFFYQYWEFHVFTRQSSVENYYQRTNSNIMVSNKNDANPGRYPGLRHTRRSKPSRHVICTLVTTFNWWLSSKDTKLRVLIKEVLVFFHWLTFRIILLFALASGNRALFLVQETTPELLYLLLFVEHSAQVH